MNDFFDLVNTQMHGLPGGKVESESLSHEFRLPSCYDIPKFREPAGDSQAQLVPSARCKLLPDKVLFFVFYNLPHDKAQLNASSELQSRGWMFLEEQMLWMKPVAKKSKRGSEDRQALVFNPKLWEEETVDLQED